MLRRLGLLFARIGVAAGPAEALAQLRHHYSTPPRAYHNLGHVEDCLLQFDAACHLAHNPDAVEMAILFHDAIYDVRMHDNEERSASLAYDWLLSNRACAGFTQSVSSLILASKHAGIPLDDDARLFTDIDLSILGRSWEEFTVYDKKIEQEYLPVYGERYWQGRKDVLQSFLGRPRIYATDFFEDLYEKQARENIKRRIAA